MAESGTLHDAFLDELRDAYDAEKQLLKALPKMAKAATADELRTAFQAHLEETKGHVAAMEESFDDATMDACLIGSGRRAEHYEMAAYSTMIGWARAMGHSEAVTLLEEILDEERAADEKLSGLAEDGIDQEAADVQTIVSLVAAGIGVSLLISPAPLSNPEAVVYRELSDDLPRWQLSVAWSPDNRSPVLARFLDLL